jgi:hypothetical protein
VQRYDSRVQARQNPEQRRERVSPPGHAVNQLAVLTGSFDQLHELNVLGLPHSAPPGHFAVKMTHGCGFPAHSSLFLV